MRHIETLAGTTFGTGCVGLVPATLIEHQAVRELLGKVSVELIVAGLIVAGLAALTKRYKTAEYGTGGYD